MRLRIDNPEQFLALLPQPHDKVGRWMGTALELGGGIAKNPGKNGSPGHGVLTLDSSDKVFAYQLASLFVGQVSPRPTGKSISYQVRWYAHRAHGLSELTIEYALSRREDLQAVLSINDDPSSSQDSQASVIPVDLDQCIKHVQDPVSLASALENTKVLAEENIKSRNFGFTTSNKLLLEALQAVYEGKIRQVAEAGETFLRNGAEVRSNKDLWRWSLSKKDHIRAVLQHARKGAFFKAEQIRQLLLCLD